MDFFSQQDRAKTKTTYLLFLFAVAVLLIILAVYTAVWAILIRSAQPGRFNGAADFFQPEIFGAVAAGTALVISLGSLFKIIALARGGGRYVAESLGGRLVNPATNEPEERRLINVVEEMAIASGVPVPQIFILEGENGINAFAAGFSANDAVVGVTMGGCRLLDRDELQGVIAHEFSHILNGDMRLNLRLLGFLSGIMVIANIGSVILRSGNSRSSSRGRGKGAGQIMLLALVFLLIGYVGVLLGRLIQSAVSRQREFLADASAVQFTRNPDGIANALKKIGGLAEGSKITASATDETCHIFFSQAISSLFATHPPLSERIRRLGPAFQGKSSSGAAAARKSSQASAAMGLASTSAFDTAAAPLPLKTGAVLNRVGTITPEQMARGAELLADVPPEIRSEMHDILGASAVVCTLLLDKEPGMRKKQLALLEPQAPAGLLRQITILEPHLLKLAPGLRLVVLDLIFPALRLMSSSQYQELLACLEILAQADKSLSLFEFCLQQIVNHRLGAIFGNTRQKTRYNSLAGLLPETVCLLSILAVSGHADETAAQSAFQAGLAVLPVRSGEIKMLPLNRLTFKDLETALHCFTAATPGVKKTVFEACVNCVLFDAKVAEEEAEILRVVAYVMDLPLPPFLAQTG